MLPVFLKGVSKFVVKNSTTILTGIGVVGVVATTVLTYKATKNTIEEIVNLRVDAEEANPDAEEIKIEKSDIFKASWKHWIPVVTTVAITITSIIAAHRINVGKLAALASAYKLSEDTRKNYKQAVLDKLGANKEKEIDGKAHINGALETLTNSCLPPIETIQKTGCGDQYIYLDFLGGWFMSSIPAIQKQLNDYSIELKNQSFAEGSVADILESMNLEAPAWTRNATWTVDGEKERTYNISPSFEPHKLPDGSFATALVLNPGENMPKFTL